MTTLQPFELIESLLYDIELLRITLQSHRVVIQSPQKILNPCLKIKSTVAQRDERCIHLGHGL